MRNQKYSSFGNHLRGLLFILALVSLVDGDALARTTSVRRSSARPVLAGNPAETANGAPRDLMSAERPRRVTSSETGSNNLLPSTSDVIFKSMPKLPSASGPVIQANGTIPVPVKPAASLDAWPGLNFCDTWAARGVAASRGLASWDGLKAHPIGVSHLIDSTTDLDVSGSPAGPPGQKPRGIVSTAPMTAGEKFTYFLRKSFMPPTPYALSVLGGVFGEALDTKDKKHRNDAGEFLADSMTRAARSFAFRSTANFLEKFAYATMFKQDPRYHRSNNTGFGARVGYAISRIFITQGDRGGRQFNASFIVGGLSAAGMSNLWVRDEHVNIGDTFVRWGEHVGLTALSNILREFIGGQ